MSQAVTPGIHLSNGESSFDGEDFSVTMEARQSEAGGVSEGGKRLSEGGSHSTPPEIPSGGYGARKKSFSMGRPVRRSIDILVPIPTIPERSPSGGGSPGAVNSPAK